MGEKVQIDGENLVRDIHSKAILSTNYDELAAHRQRRAVMLQQKSENDRLREEINTIKQEFAEVKELLQLMLKK
jgi:hypothetical protein